MQADAERDRLEVLASEFMERIRRGDAPSIDEYEAANPDLAEGIRELFPTIAAAEQLKLRWTSAEAPRTRVRDDGGATPTDGGAPPVGHTVLADGAADTPEPRPRAHEGMRLGKYTLLCRLGEGSMGTVWLSRHPDLGIRVAVKTLRSGVVAATRERTQRFVREAHTAALINHPHVVRVFDAGVDCDLHYIVMEFVEGGTVGDLVRQAGGRLPVPRAVEITAAVAEALQAAADVGIVHRDIKPENIMLDSKGIPKLADLGLAKQMSAADEDSVTATGTGLGTPLYVAPEQAMGRGAADIRSDIYSLGATFYHVVTGEPPFTGSTPYDIVNRHLYEPLLDPRQRVPELPADVARVIRKMLAKQPEDRYQTPAELAADLAGQGRSEAVVAPGGESSERGTPWLAVAAAALVLAALAFTARSALRPRGPPEKLTAAQSVPGPADGRWAEQPGSTRVGVAMPGGPGRPEGAAYTTPSDDGSLRLDDWQVAEGLPGSPDSRPIPIQSVRHSFEDGELSVAGEAGGDVSTLIYGTLPLEGPFTIRMEARNVVSVGIAEPFSELEPCRIDLADPSQATGSGHGWQTIEIHRERGRLTCLVDGKPAHAITGSHISRGRFSIRLRPGIRCYVRTFRLSLPRAPHRPGTQGGQDPGRGHPPPPGGDLRPPR